MNNIKTGDLAFTLAHGMTLRDYFAAKAMQAYMSDPQIGWCDSKMAKEAYVMADAMLEVRGDL